MKLKIAILFFIFFTCGFFRTFAQQDTVRFAKIKLENGTYIRGYILQDITAGNLVLKTPSGNAFFVKMDDIIKMKFGKYAVLDKSDKSVKPVALNNIYDQRIGTYSLFGVGLNFSEMDAHLSLTSELGKRFNDHFALGVGINYDRDYWVSNLPIYFNGRAYLNNRKVSPFVYAGAGYSLAWANDDWYYEFNKVNGGFMGQLGLGYQINFAGSALLFNVGYKIQRVFQDYSTYNYGYQPWPGSSSFSEPNVNIKEIRLLRRAEFKLSFMF